MDNEKVLKTETDNWELTSTKLWPEKGFLSFFAYYPYIDGTTPNGLSINSTENQVPVITYNKPKYVQHQPDLLLSTILQDDI